MTSNSFFIAKAMLVALLFAFAPNIAVAQVVRSRPIDQATVRVIGVSGVERREAQTDTETRVQFQTAMSHGSGVVISEQLIATAAHVVADLDRIYIRVVGESDVRSARVAAIDEANDVALLQVAPLNTPAFPVPDVVVELSPGEVLHMTGYPVDVRQNNPAAASGPLSRLTNEGAFEIAAALNPGNSGGPVLNGADQLIAIVSARGRVDRGIQGIALATPISHVQSLMAQVQLQTVPEAPGNIDWLLDDSADAPTNTASLSPLFAALYAHRLWRGVLRRLFDFRVAHFEGLPPNVQTQVQQDIELARTALGRAFTDTSLVERYRLQELQAQLNGFYHRGRTQLGNTSTTVMTNRPLVDRLEVRVR